MNKKNLIKFENDIANTFNKGKIKAPIHLYSNNEDFLINFFKKIKKKGLGFLYMEISLSMFAQRCATCKIKKRNIGWKINLTLFSRI